ncbi:MAG: hypothetical protein WC445_01160 [Patescibacteria group bacterium]
MQKLFNSKWFKRISIGILAVAILIIPLITAAQMGGGISVPNFFKRVGNAINPTNSSWTLGSSGTPLANGYFTALTAGTLTISSTVSGDLSVGGVIKASAGTAAAPSITFTANPDTGFYYSADTMGVVINGTIVGSFTGSGVRATQFMNTAAAHVSILGMNADGATAYATKIGSNTALTTVGAKIVGFYNDGFVTEKAYIDKDGNMYLGGGAMIALTSNTAAYFAGNISNGASAIGVQIGNINALSTAGAKIVSFYSDNRTTEKAYVDYLGSFNAGAGTALLPAYSFVADPNTGIYSYGADQIGFTTNGVARASLDQTAFWNSTFYSFGAATITMKGQVADGASAVGVTLGSYVSQTTAGGKLLSVVNNTTEKAFIDKDGAFGSVLGAATIANAATTFAAQGNVMTVTGDAGGNTVATITAGVVGQRLTMKFVDALVTITDTDAATANTVNLSAAFTSTANDTMTIVFDGNKWFEVSRAIN